MQCGAEKCKVTTFRMKVDFCQRKFATKFICAKTVNAKVVRPI